MQSSHDVELRYRFRIARSRRLPSFFKRHRVSTVSVFLASKCTQPTCCNANIRRIDVAIYIEERGVAPELLPDVIGKPSDGQNVWRAIQRESIFEAQPFP